MLNWIVIILAALLLPALLYGEKREKPGIIVPFKTVLSALFIVAVWIQPHEAVPRYFTFLMPGLVFCLLGDVFLALPRERMFLLGLISFLLGHVFYVFAFFSAGSIAYLSWTGILIILVAGCSVFFWLKPHLGSMKIPVLLYVIVISIMVCGAVAVFKNPGLAMQGRLAVLIGAAFFYISDIFVARDRFLKKGFVNRLFGLPLYYFGQFLLAFSAGLLK